VGERYGRAEKAVAALRRQKEELDIETRLDPRKVAPELPFAILLDQIVVPSAFISTLTETVANWHVGTDRRCYAHRHSSRTGPGHCGS
jgi:hypothetical protein